MVDKRVSTALFCNIDESSTKAHPLPEDLNNQYEENNSSQLDISQIRDLGCSDLPQMEPKLEIAGSDHNPYDEGEEEVVLFEQQLKSSC